MGRTYRVSPGVSPLESLSESIDHGFQNMLEELPFISPLQTFFEHQLAPGTAQSMGNTG